MGCGIVIAAVLHAISRIPSRLTVSAPDCLARLGLTKAVSGRSTKQATFSYSSHQAAVTALASFLKKPGIALPFECATGKVIKSALWQARLRTNCVEWHVLGLAEKLFDCLSEVFEPGSAIRSPVDPAKSRAQVVWRDIHEHLALVPTEGHYVQSVVGSGELNRRFSAVAAFQCSLNGATLHVAIASGFNQLLRAGSDLAALSRAAERQSEKLALPVGQCEAWHKTTTSLRPSLHWDVVVSKLVGEWTWFLLRCC